MDGTKENIQSLKIRTRNVLTVKQKFQMSSTTTVLLLRTPVLYNSSAGSCKKHPKKRLPHQKNTAKTVEKSQCGQVAGIWTTSTLLRRLSTRLWSVSVRFFHPLVQKTISPFYSIPKMCDGLELRVYQVLPSVPLRTCLVHWKQKNGRLQTVPAKLDAYQICLVHKKKCLADMKTWNPYTTMS